MERVDVATLVSGEAPNIMLPQGLTVWKVSLDGYGMILALKYAKQNAAILHAGNF